MTQRGIGLRVLAGEGAAIDTTTATGKLGFGIFAALSEFERELILERTRAGLKAARARGRLGGRPFLMTPAKLRLAYAVMKSRDAPVSELCEERRRQSKDALPARRSGRSRSSALNVSVAR